MVFDITNCLEKFEYEDIRLKQDYELKLSSYAFDSSSPMIITDEKNNIIKGKSSILSNSWLFKRRVNWSKTLVFLKQLIKIKL